ncbi:MAG: NAD-dependent epimerase/dehydratase family protein [Mycobacteriales bacterium]
MRVLVTGAAGFIGATLVDRLIAEGHEVTGVDDLSTGKLANLHDARLVNEQERPGAFAFVRSDVSESRFPEILRKADPEVVYHLAAQIDVRVSVRDPLLDTKVNVLGTVNLLQAAVESGVRKVVFTSSGGSIYGSRDKLPVNERTALAPESPYAAGKGAGELYLHAFEKMHGLAYTSLALANVYGPRQNPHGEAGVVAIFAGQMLAGEATKVFGDGGNTRDYVYVDDVVDAFVKASGTKGAGKRFNIGTGVQTTDRELHTLVAKAVGAPDDPAFAPARTGDARAIALDASAAKAIGWAPWTDLPTGIEQTVAWLRSTL